MLPEKNSLVSWEFGNRDQAIARPLSREALDMRHCLPARWAGGSVFAATL